MQSIHHLKYPKSLNKIFDKLYQHEIKSIIIGGFIRDFLLNIESKDIDIELYGVASLEQLQSILQEFGSVNMVGKSFGVCKLSLKNLEIDFTLPRRDNKIALGHSGFLIEIDNTLDFKTASSRRDFTMNAIGYDVHKKIFLDPFNGKDALEKKIIRAIDINIFAQDPLRVLRAVSFCSRLNFTLDNQLFILCKSMCEKNILQELPKERIYSEIEKILLKSPLPSVGFNLLKDLGGLHLLHPLQTLQNKDFLFILESLNRLKALVIDNKNTYLLVSFCVLCSQFSIKDTSIFINNLTNEHKLSVNIQRILKVRFENKYTDSELLILATQVNIELFLLYSHVLYPTINIKIFDSIKKRAIKLNVLYTKQKEFLQGRDILALGIKPSKEYSKILSLAYTKQMKLEIKNHKEALEWLHKYLTI